MAAAAPPSHTATLRVVSLTPQLLIATSAAIQTIALLALPCCEQPVASPCFRSTLLFTPSALSHDGLSLVAVEAKAANACTIRCDLVLLTSSRQEATPNSQPGQVGNDSKGLPPLSRCCLLLPAVPHSPD